MPCEAISLLTKDVTVIIVSFLAKALTVPTKVAVPVGKSFETDVYVMPGISTERQHK